MQRLTRQQQTAIEHLHEWKVGALFMETGTGKTRVAMNLVSTTKCSDIFWIAPLRTLDNVKCEISKWGGFRCNIHYYGVESISGSDRIYMELYNLVEKSANPFVIVDESLKIKNATAKRTKRILEIGKIAEYKLVLNGTPISRNLLDMWSQMQFLSPKILNMTLSQFKNTFCKYTTITKKTAWRSYSFEYITGMENIDYLYSLIGHYVYECDLQLNITQRWHTKYYTISYLSKEIYEDIKDRYLSNEALDRFNNNIFFAMTTELQMSYCCDMGKIEAVRSIFDSGINEKETLIFCRYIKSMNLCQDMFPKATIVSIQKGSLGLNLQQFSNTIYFDKVWDYALYIQSTRRTFRTGQERDCNYWSLTGNIGLEHLIDRNISKKISMTEYLKAKSIQEIKSEL